MSAPRKAALRTTPAQTETESKIFANLRMQSILSILELHSDSPKQTMHHLGHLAHDPAMMDIVVQALKQLARSQDFRAWLAQERDWLGQVHEREQRQAQALEQRETHRRRQFTASRRDRAFQALLERIATPPGQ